MPPVALHALDEVLQNEVTKKKPEEEKIHPLDAMKSQPWRWLSILFFSFATNLIRLGATRPLQTEDCPPLRRLERLDVLFARMDRHTEGNELSIFKVFWATFKRQWAGGASMLLINLLGHVFQMIFIKALLILLNPTKAEVPDSFTAGWSGEALAVGLTIAQIWTSVTMNNGMFQRMTLGFSVRSLLTSMVYRKALRMAAHDKQKSTTGQIVTLMSVDAERLYQAAMVVDWLWVGPIMICIAMGLICREIGPSGITTIVLMVLLGKLSKKVAVRLGKARRGMMKYTDERVKQVNEVLMGIRVIKYMAWEVPIARQVEQARHKEMKQLQVN
jgi:ABC-type multidrug transport system fused ATPase/permease subunit